MNNFLFWPKAKILCTLLYPTRGDAPGYSKNGSTAKIPKLFLSHSLEVNRSLHLRAVGPQAEGRIADKKDLFS